MSRTDLSPGAGLSPGRKAVTVLICIAVFLFALIAQAGAGLEKTLFSANFYRALTAELELPALAHSYLLKRLLARDDADLPPQSVISRAVAAAASPEWLGQQFDSVTDDLAALLRGERDDLVLVVDLRGRKDIFKRELLGGLSGDRLEELELNGSFVDAFIEQAALPDELLLADFNPVDGLGPGAAPALRRVRQGGGYFRVAPYLVLGALLLLCCCWSGRGKGLRLFGGAMFAGGLAGLLGLYGGLPLLLARAGQRMTILEGGIGACISANPHLAASALRIIRQSLLFIPLGVAAAGLALLLAGQCMKTDV